jgi:hypothetical protein
MVPERRGQGYVAGRENSDITCNIYILLKAAMARRSESKTLAVPKIEGLVVLTGKADRSRIVETEAAKVLILVYLPRRRSEAPTETSRAVSG